MPPENYFLSIGSNVSPEKNIAACLQALKQRYEVTRISSTFETPPFGPCGTIHFWNLAVKLQCTHTREQLQKELIALEDLQGRERERANKFAPRTIDLDLLPKPGYEKLAFVIIPLAEIAPEERDPYSGKTFGELAATLSTEASRFKKVSAAWTAD